MKQIINIQLGGRSIAIEDTAAQKVQQYLESLRAHFSKEPGRDEILADIEARFSELMFEKLRKGAPHIAEADVDEMIATMGRPEDFAEEAGTDSQAQDSSSQSRFAAGSRKLYRDANNKVLGGVCSGVANWINIDPSIVRVLFAIIAFGSFGTGLLIYILLWIFLPARDLEGYKGKRLFRNPDDKKIGGVASGIAAYFGKEANTVRLIFALPFILSIINGIFSHGNFDPFRGVFFGSLSGTFLTAYIILWIVLPEAISPYEKMEMHGQPVDLNSIKNNVQNSMGDVSSRIRNWGKEVQDSAERFGNSGTTYGRNFGREFGSAAGRGARGLGHGIAVVIKAIFLIIFGTIIFSLFIGLLALLFSGYVFAPFNNFLWTSENQQFLAWATVLLFIGAPIVGSVIWLFRMILNVTTPGNYLNWLFGGLWAFGWVFLVLFVSSISRDFKRNQSAETSVAITQPRNGKLILTVSQPELEFNGDFTWMRDTDGDRISGFSLTKDTLKLSDISILFEKSPDSLYHVAIDRQSFGNTDEEALARLNKIHYTVSSADSILDLASGFSVDKTSKYRMQRVQVIVQVPVGKKVQLDPSVNEKLNTLDIEVESGKAGIRRIRERRNYRYYTPNIAYTMMENGSLKSEHEPEESNTITPGADTTYRWKEPAGSKDSAKEVPAGTYRYSSAAETVQKDSAASSKPVNLSKEELNHLLQQKEKEIEELRKKVNR
ncbi:PspC domain-containing protein [Niabella drilacis]|uniref:Phage shock protein C (PspC) family protein n=1 Tax=Niabella drilacis (strain DSM 25811 / CCM 8410 / CCUG 62505 / LMG 26954 / E90) TaxID=1285928 RepID=A0A1G6XWV6_NIADE|nr:PspC domain-containing protein [Niabella drilacis]SDD82659.1 phage shock protein C (PspC) family protein [Niabella drilacis]